MTRISLVGFDADDTLWRSEDYYRAAQAEFERIIAGYVDLEGGGSGIVDDGDSDRLSSTTGHIIYYFDSIGTSIEAGDGCSRRTGYSYTISGITLLCIDIIEVIDESS